MPLPTVCGTLQLPGRDFSSLNFYFIFWEVGLQGQRVDAKGWEMNGIEMYDVKPQRINKLFKKSTSATVRTATGLSLPPSLPSYMAAYAFSPGEQHV